jgi:hypothetical protein
MASLPQHWLIHANAKFHGLYGKHLRVLSEVPFEHWLRPVGYETPEPIPSWLPPDMVVDVDPQREADEMRAVERAMAEQSKPDRMLTSAELLKKLPAVKDATWFDVASTRWGFPAPRRRENSFTGALVGYVWSERAVDGWVTAKRKDHAQLDVLLGA